MRRLAAFLAAACAWAAAPARASEPPRLPLDLSADVLEPGQTEIGVFWGRYRRGLGHGLQLTTHIAGDAVGILNASLKWRFVDRPELRASFELGAVWAVLLDLLPGETTAPLALVVPGRFDATVPLADDLSLDLALNARDAILSAAGQRLGIATLDGQLTLVRTDPTGAWLAQVTVPLVSRADEAAEELLGKSNVARAITLSELPGWGVLVGRDLATKGSAHVRLGAGYRHTPGLLLFDSIGRLVLSFDVYFR